MEQLLTFLLANDNLMFSGALFVMLILFLIEVGCSLISGAGVGELLDMGADADIDADLSVDHDASIAPHLLTWLRFGEVPFMIWLISFLTTFGVVGIAGQSFLLNNFGFTLPALLAVPAALITSLPIVRGLCGIFSKIIPKEESSVINEDEFIGQEAVISLGNASVKDDSGNIINTPAQAKIFDRYNRPHYVLVYCNTGTEKLSHNQKIILISKKSSGQFFAEPKLSDTIDNEDDLIGAEAMIVTGEASLTQNESGEWIHVPAQAKVFDKNNNPHHVTVYCNDGVKKLQQFQKIILIGKKENGKFLAEPDLSSTSHLMVQSGQIISTKNKDPQKIYDIN